MPNLLSFPFIVLLCLFFLLVTFVWLIILNNELPCTFEQLSYFLSLHQLNFCVNGFKAFIISGKFSASNQEVLFSILLSSTSYWILSTYTVVFLKFQSSVMDNQIFPTFFPLVFSMSLFNILNAVQLHEYKDYCCHKHFNVLPC